MNRVEEIINILSTHYPDAHCELNYNSNFELLVAVILSAQCTDKRVNIVTSELFKKYNKPMDFANMDNAMLEELIRPCGFYRNKAKSIISTSKDIIEKFGGEIPSNFNDLLSLRGVGRKTANVVAGIAFNQPTIAVDTHVFRVARRLGLSNANTPEGVEKDLVSLISEDLRNKSHHLFIFFGRYCCHSRNPGCDNCCLKIYCKK